MGGSRRREMGGGARGLVGEREGGVERRGVGRLGWLWDYAIAWEYHIKSIAELKGRRVGEWWLLAYSIGFNELTCRCSPQLLHPSCACPVESA